ncbi:hypothetical protein QJQ45_017198 [Haematococcus lacustris]|nr:hypothetical protein QJQ45_017198 [Haematococcus lacustris]
MHKVAHIPNERTSIQSNSIELIQSLGCPAVTGVATKVGSLDTRSHLQIAKQFLHPRRSKGEYRVEQQLRSSTTSTSSELCQQAQRALTNHTAGALSCAGMATLDEQMKKVQEEFDDVKDKITRIEALPEGNPERQRLVELERAQNFLREKEILLLRAVAVAPAQGAAAAIGASTNNPFQPSAPSKWMITILLVAYEGPASPAQPAQPAQQPLPSRTRPKTRNRLAMEGAKDRTHPGNSNAGMKVVVVVGLCFTSFRHCLRTRWQQPPRTSVYDVQVPGEALESAVRMTHGSVVIWQGIRV